MVILYIPLLEICDYRCAYNKYAGPERGRTKNGTKSFQKETKLLLISIISNPSAETINTDFFI